MKLIGGPSGRERVLSHLTKEQKGDWTIFSAPAEVNLERPNKETNVLYLLRMSGGQSLTKDEEGEEHIEDEIIPLDTKPFNRYSVHIREARNKETDFP